MSRVVNPNGGELADLLKRVRALEKATPLASASIGRGRLRLYDGSELLIEDGNLTISGIATVDGQLIGSGTLEWTGPVTFTGDTSLNGPTHIDGATDINGTLAVKGATTLTDDLTVGSGGKIKVGAMTLDPAVSGAGGVGGITALVTLLLSAPQVVITNGATVDGNLNAAGGVTITNLPTISGKTSNLYLDTADLNTLKLIV